MNQDRAPGSFKQQVKNQLYRTWGTFSQTFRDPYEHILILATVRSGSTLLVHLLTSNPEICGMGESKIPLNSARDFNLITGRNMFFHWREKMPKAGDERYIMDKLVRDNLLDPQDIDLLKNPDVRIIFLLREPGATINSHMRAAEIIEQDALAYFVTRLHTLAEYARGLGRKESVFLTYQDILECTQPAFNLLQDYLDLQQPLCENYQVTSTTGNFDVGDKSENIKSGRIVSNTNAPALQLSPATMAAAQEAYTACVKTLQQRCQHLTADQCKNN